MLGPVEPRADLGRVGVVQVFEDIEGLLPGLAGFLRFPGGVAGVAKVGEDLRLGVAVAKAPDDVKGAAVAAGGRGRVAELVLAGRW
jgi:hypothetical protein